MKISCDKYEYAKMIRSCKSTTDGYSCNSKCVLSDVCQGQPWLEDHVEIVPVEEKECKKND